MSNQISRPKDKLKIWLIVALLNKKGYFLKLVSLTKREHEGIGWIIVKQNDIWTVKLPLLEVWAVDSLVLVSTRKGKCKLCKNN